MKNNNEKFDFIVNSLRGLIPEPKRELVFSNNLELLIAVMLSAQCTDKRVNIITEKLFKKYKRNRNSKNWRFYEIKR